MTKVMSAIFMMLIFEIIVFGPIGMVISGVAVRKLLIALLLLMSIYQLLSVGRLKIWYMSFLYGLTLFVAIWGVAIPLFKGVPQSMSFAEVTPLAGLFLILPIQHLFEKRGPRYYLGVAQWASFALAVIVTMTWFLVNVLGQIDFGLAVRHLYIAINQTDAGIYIGPMPDGSFRVMLIGCMVFPLLLAYHNWNGFSFGWTAFYLIAIYATGTRAFLLAGACTLVVSLLARRPGVAAVVAVLALVTYPLIHPLLEGKRIFELASELSDESARFVQFFSLMDLFFDNPIFGAGFGAHAEVLRSENAPYSYELTYVALLAKLGLIGVVLVLVWVGAITVSALNRFSAQRSSVVGILLALILMTATNPYLINSLGMAVMAFLISLTKHYAGGTHIDQHTVNQHCPAGRALS